MARKKKKAKGFKVSDSFVCYNKDNKLFLLSLAAHNSLEKCVKTTHNSLEKCVKTTHNSLEKCVKTTHNSPEKCEVGEYCPKITGCCCDYTKKKTTEGDRKSVA